MDRRRRTRARRCLLCGTHRRRCSGRDEHSAACSRPRGAGGEHEMTWNAKLSDFALYRRLVRYAVPYWPYILGIFVLGLLASPIALLNPLPLKIAVDSVLGSTPLPSFLDSVLPAELTASKRGILWVAVGLLLTVALLGQLRDLAYSVLKAFVNERLTLDFRTDLFDRAQRASLVYHDDVGTTDTLYRIEHDGAALNHLVVESVISFVVVAVV